MTGSRNLRSPSHNPGGPTFGLPSPGPSSSPPLDKSELLSAQERRVIEKHFYKAGPLTTQIAVENFFAGLGQRFTSSELSAWFPEEDVPEEGAFCPTRRPLSLSEVLDALQLKKDEHALLSRDPDEMLATFVGLGGNIDGSGKAHIGSLIDAALTLRGEQPTTTSKVRTTTGEAAAATTSLRRPSNAVRSDSEDNGLEEDEEESEEHHPKMLANSQSAEQMASTQLRVMPRHTTFAEFIEAMHTLRAAVVGPRDRLVPALAPPMVGTPCDEDLKPVRQSMPRGSMIGDNLIRKTHDHLRAVNALSARSSVALSRSTIGPSSTAGGGYAPHGGGGDDGWSSGGEEDGLFHEDTFVQAYDEEDESNAQSQHLREEVTRVIHHFHERRSANTPDSLLDRLSQVQSVSRAPMAPDGVSLVELEMYRKKKPLPTKPIEPIMLMRERAKQEILLMETEKLIKQQMESVERKQAVSRGGGGGKKGISTVRSNSHHASNATTTTTGQQDSSEPRQRPQSAFDRLSRKAKPSVDEANEFVKSVAKHATYIERVNERPKSACSNVKPALRLARSKAKYVVERWRAKAVDKLVIAREQALELMIAKELAAPEIQHGEELLRPPSSGFETKRTEGDTRGVADKVEPFLKFPGPRVYSKLRLATSIAASTTATNEKRTQTPKSGGHHWDEL